ncbi:ABC transporter substrate-binding protein [Duganella sp.]|uniref:substrate-binding periplasmic protein n=1 Tax=Duganella sp. TaxID=1904440 RepID=UPI0031DB181D
MWSSFPLRGMLAAAAALLAVQGGAVELHTSAHINTEPKFAAGPGKKVVGLCVDLLRALERADPGMRFVGDQNWMPMMRAMTETRAGRQDVVCGLAHTAQRAVQFVYLQPVLWHIDYVLVARENDDVVVNSWEDVRKLGAQGVVLSDRGMYASHLVESQADVTFDSSAASSEHNLKKLLAGRGRFYLHRVQGLDSLLLESGVKPQVRVLPVIMGRVPLYFTVGQHVDTGMAQRMQQGLLTLQKNGELARIRRRWNLAE